MTTPALAPSVAPHPSSHSGTATPRARALTPASAPWWLAAIIVVTLLGFQRTIAKGPGGLDLAHAVHGTAALGWSALLVVQAWLAERGLRHRHRQLAAPAVICAVTMIASSVPMVLSLSAAAGANARFRPIGARLVVMDVLLLALFLTLFAVAIANVRRPVRHARAMAATGLLALPAGLGRAYMRLFATDPATGSYLALATGAALLVALIISDRRAGLRDRTFPAILVTLVMVGILTPTLADSAWFLHLLALAGSP